MSSEQAEHEATRNECNTHTAAADTEPQLISVLTAMQASMDRQNMFLEGIFNEKQAAEKRPRAIDRVDLDEAKNGEQSAPKRAKTAPKSGLDSDGNDRPCIAQQSSDHDTEVCEDPPEAEHDKHADALSLFGGPDFADEIDDLDNDNLLSNIALNLSSTEQTGPPISEHLAKIINSKLADELDITKLKEILSKYQRPQNCEEMYVPKVNPEIWQKLKPYAKKSDIKLANLQDTIIKGLSSLATSMNTLLECRETKTIPDYKAIIPQLLDTTALFGHVWNEISYKRKAAIRPILHPDFKPLCSRSHKVGPLLFGEDLAKTAQDVRNLSKAVASLTTQFAGQSSQSYQTKRFSPYPPQTSRPFLSQRGRAHFPPRRHQNYQNRKQFKKN